MFPACPAISLMQRNRSSRMRQFPPSRIVCLTEETVETLYLLGEQHRIVGVSGYAVRPPEVRREKPRVSAFVSADIPKILALAPDLVLAFSDLQATIVADLVRAGVAVHVFNQRDIAGILAMIRMLGALVGAADRAEELAAGFENVSPWGAGRRSHHGETVSKPAANSSARSAAPTSAPSIRIMARMPAISRWLKTWTATPARTRSATIVACR